MDVIRAMFSRRLNLGFDEYYRVSGLCCFLRMRDLIALGLGMSAASSMGMLEELVNSHTHAIITVNTDEFPLGSFFSHQWCYAPGNELWQQESELLSRGGRGATPRLSVTSHRGALKTAWSVMTLRQFQISMGRCRRLRVHSF
jgi:hypothetical protein